MPRETFAALQRFLSLGVLAGVTALFAWLLWPFLMSVFWASVAAILLYPLFKKLRGTSQKRASAAAAVTMLIALIGVGLPLYVVGSLVVEESLVAYHAVAAGDINAQSVLQNPYVADTLVALGLNPAEVGAQVSAWVTHAASYIASQAVAISLATLSTLLSFGIMLYLLFFFLRDGERLLRYIERIIPLGNEREELLFKRFSSTTRAVVKGTLIVSIAQGFVGAILFLIAGVPNAALWGAVMALCATIPAVGPFIVWIPAGLLLLASGAIWQGVLVLVGGAVIIGSIDNVLRPILVGRDTEMPDALILLAILGGIATFGMAGIIIGPVIGALFLSIWDLFGKDFGEELSARG